ncbi:MAG: flap endonuclease [Acidobacteria bacterium]|nr:MAG: flap endonuclease [Acidobacteriota bacterium]
MRCAGAGEADVAAPERGATVYLVDGTYELFRQFYGAPRRSSPDGQEIGAVAGLRRSLASLVRRRGVTHGAVAFDRVIESFRNRLFPGYKTSAGEPPELLAQFLPAERAARAVGFAVWPMIEFEADDALATAADRLARDPRVARIVICSPDKDLLQCVRGRRVVCLDRRRDRIVDEAAARERFGIPPERIPDWLALVGDAADGIPGLPGFGPATASRLLALWPGIEAIPTDPRQWPAGLRGAARLARTLEERRGEALLYRRLATLRRDAPVAADLDELRIRPFGDAPSFV